MEIKKVHIKQISKSATFLAQYHISIEPIKVAYRKYLNNFRETYDLLGRMETAKCDFDVAFHDKKIKNEYFYKQVTVRFCEIRFDYS